MIIEIALGIVLAVLILRYGGEVVYLFFENFWTIVGGTLATVAALAVLLVLLVAPDSFAADVILAAFGAVLLGALVLFVRDSYRELSKGREVRARQVALGLVAAILLLVYLTIAGVIRWSEPVVAVSVAFGAAIWGLVASFLPGQMTRRERGLVAGVCATLLSLFPVALLVRLLIWNDSNMIEFIIFGAALAVGVVAARYARNTATASRKPVVIDVSSR